MDRIAAAVCAVALNLMCDTCVVELFARALGVCRMLEGARARRAGLVVRALEGPVERAVVVHYGAAVAHEALRCITLPEISALGGRGSHEGARDSKLHHGVTKNVK